MQNEKKYFASANTEKGFVSYFDEIYGGLKSLYIIKGGPGTGKSSLIRSIADEGEKRGHNVEYFYCSSDPLSLDGIIIEDLNCGVIDGTSPHTYEPTYPGVREKIINLGENWDEGRLKKYEKEIYEIVDRKKGLYNNVYNYLAAVGRVENEIRVCNRRYLLKEKMKMAVMRLSKGWKNGKGFEKIIRPIEGISHAGKIIYPSYHYAASNKYTVKDRYGIGGVFTEMLIDVAERKEMKVVYSPGVVDKSGYMGVYLPECDSSFVICEDEGRDVKVINMDRFIDLEAIKNNKQKNRFARRCLASLYEGVQKGFDEISELHARLEDYYKGAMNFGKNDMTAQRIKKEIFEKQ